MIGRFLSRDPLLFARTAARTNPYAFAFNDPQNRSDPTGLDPGCLGEERVDYAYDSAARLRSEIVVEGVVRVPPDHPSRS